MIRSIAAQWQRLRPACPCNTRAGAAIYTICSSHPHCCHTAALGGDRIQLSSDRGVRGNSRWWPRRSSESHALHQAVQGQPQRRAGQQLRWCAARGIDGSDSVGRPKKKLVFLGTPEARLPTHPTRSRSAHHTAASRPIQPTWKHSPCQRTSKRDFPAV